MHVFLTSPEWDGLRNWLATIGGLIALSIAANTYRRNVRLKREEQARLVYSEASGFGAVKAMGDVVANSRGDSSTTWSCIRPVGESMVATEPILQVRLVISNGSKELIGPIRVRMVDRDKGTFFHQGDKPFEALIDSIRPETDHIANLAFPIGDHEPRAWTGSNIQFRDASGQWWGRHLREPIQLLRTKTVQFEYR